MFGEKSSPFAIFLFCFYEACARYEKADEILIFILYRAIMCKSSITWKVNTMFDRLREFSDSLVKWGLPGLDLSVWQSGREIFRYQSGYRDLENKLPMTGEGAVQYLFLLEAHYLYLCASALGKGTLFS